MNYDLLKSWKNRVPKHIWLCFITGVLTGWLTHFYMLTHKLPNWDEANNLTSYGSGDYLGRWFLKYIHPLGSSYSMPAVHGMLFIIFLSLSACLVLAILDLHTTTAAILVPALMVTFPSVACTMTFMFMAHTSGMAIFMICLAVYLLRKYKWGWLPCAVLLICSLGVYQSYISIAIALMLMGMISDMLSGKDFVTTVKRGILCVVVLFAAVGIYMWLCHVFYPNIDNETYGGIGNMGNIAVSQMPRLIARCYKRFLEYFIWKPFAFMSKTMQQMNILTCVLAVVFGIYHIVKGKMYRRALDCILYCILCLFMPLAVAFVYFMAPDAPFSMVMLYAYVMIYITVIMLWEKAISYWQKEQSIKWRGIVSRVLAWAMVLCIMVSCYCNYLISNTAYMRMEISYERVTSYFNRIIERVEATDGFQNGDKVAMLGEFYYLDNPSPAELGGFYTEQLRTMDGVALENGLITSGVRNNFIETFIGFDMTNLSETEKNEIMESQIYQQMPVYPAEGSIRKIEDIWIVKLCE